MSDKYIIKNCPAIYKNFEDNFVCTAQIKVKSFPFYCQNCTDCVMKQIVEKLRQLETKSEQLSFSEFKQYIDEMYINEMNDLLNIEECE